MKNVTMMFVIAILLLCPLGSSALAAESSSDLTYSGYPTISIVSLVQDDTVTFKAHNLPPNDKFRVRMGEMGTRAVNGVIVDTFTTGSGGSKGITSSIPAALYGERQIAIRIESTTGSGYYAYNWFYNRTTGNGGSGGTPDYTGFPTFTIVSVERDVSVTIKTVNLPKSDEFRVRMGKMSTRGVNGIKVVSFDTGDGGTQEHTFGIPAELHGDYRIAIRIESKTGSGYYAYNWFYNNTTGGGGGSGGQPTGYSGIPTFSIKSVVRNKSVTIKTNNLPPNDEFKTLMNYMGTRGVNGYNAGSFGTGEGGTKTLTFDIPSALHGQYKIAIRIQSKTGSGYYAYNWFYNNTTP
ncbi:MAG: hypothetical protein KAS36_04760 [Anaerolineales bacterium]|nr:hypothetical protein [Anaerolineales bacterium]